MNYPRETGSSAMRGKTAPGIYEARAFRQRPDACASLPLGGMPAGRVMLATRLSSRLKGLLFSPETDDLLVLLPCGDIHTFGMKYAIDVAFIDRRGKVGKVCRDVMPNKRLRHAGAVAVVERRAVPRREWFEEGDCLSLGGFRRVSLPAQLPSGKAASREFSHIQQESETGGCHENMSDMQSPLL